MINEEFLALLRCPLTSTTLAIADGRLVEQLNGRITAGEVVNRGGEKVERQIDGGLVDEAGTLLYPVRDDIPSLLADEAIPLDTAPFQDESS